MLNLYDFFPDLYSRAVTDISVLKKYIHLRYVTLTTNAIRDISPLGSLSHLLIVRAEQNRLNSAKIDELPYLQVYFLLLKFPKQV